jgi:glutamate-1-semialdehyde aminotransferase
MAAGIATLKYLCEHGDEIYPRLDGLSGALVDGVLVAGRQAGVEMWANRVGSMFTWLAFLSAAHTEHDVAETIAKAADVFEAGL